MNILFKFQKFLKRDSIVSKEKKFNSSDYWEKRYKLNGNSGPGSYGRLALWKAKIINAFVEKENIKTVIELGCGDGNQLLNARYPEYLGFDVSNSAIEICKRKFKNDPSKNFLNYYSIDQSVRKVDLVISLDVIFHLIDDRDFHDYMINLFNLSNRYVIIYSSNYDKEIAPHVKSRNFTKWIRDNVSPHFKLIKKIPNKYPFNENDPLNTSISDFYIYEKVK